MPVRDLEKGSEIIVDRLISHHSPLLNSINQDQLLAFVNLLKTKDFNKLDDAQLTKVKEDMEKGFIKNQISVKDPNFEYDIRVNFDQKNAVKSEWDEAISEEDFGDISIDDLLGDL